MGNCTNPEMNSRSDLRADERPNIVLIMADDLGFSDLGCYGGEIDTPNLDRLAENGLRFSQFYNNALCVATRASLLTGLYPQQTGNNLGARLRGGNNLTIAELLRSAGYLTLMSGKWHNGHQEQALPVARGFDRYSGLLSGCSNYFNPGLKRPGEPEPTHKFADNTRPWGFDDQVIHPYTPEDRAFYTTDAFTQYALEFLNQYGGDDQPFFLYFAHCAPHFPMQAWPEDIAKYRGRFMEGWDKLRERRHARLTELGIIDDQWGLSPRDARSRPWDEVEAPESWDLKMAVYAAMVDRMDQGIGRVLDKIRELGKEENTLVLFLSDNGGCGEHINRTPDLEPGPVESYSTVDAPWANMSNTPFRLYKRFDHEGGIATPFIAHWPRGIDGGRITHEVGHVMDLIATFADVAGVDYPSEHEGRSILPMEGTSLMPVMQGGRVSRARPLFWELQGCRAVRSGKWKLVTQGPPRDQVGIPVPPGIESWELYDMEVDRCELNDLAEAHPDLVKELDARWQAWCERCERDRPDK